ncbi:MAG: substrate-binding domain-containing protein [Oceanipulchritudo sp.]
MEALFIGVSLPASVGFCRQILTGVRAGCTARGLGMNILSDSGSIGPPRNEHQHNLPPLAGIVAHISTPEEFTAWSRLSPHVVGTSNRCAARNFPKIINDETAIGRMGAEHLLSLGLRRLVFLDKRAMAFSQARRDGFILAAREAGVQVASIGFGRSEELSGIGHELLKMTPPVGVMAESDMTARAFIEQMPDFRKVVPHRIAVLGVDDDSLQNALSPVELSSVRPNGQEIGVRAAEWVLSLNKGLPCPPEPVQVRPIRVIERASTNVLAISDPVVARAVRLMRDRVAEFRDVKDVLRALGMQRRALEKRFQKVYHRSIASELTHARLNTARSLLESTNLSINEIADLVGYPEYRLLTLAFKRLTGEPPSAYRKRVRGG